MFTEATKEKLYLRMALDGPAGSGKTFTGLKIGQALAELVGGKLACADSEKHNARKYAHLFKFAHAPIDDYSPKTYTAVIKAAVEQDFSVLVIDSLSHAWAGAGGALDIADKATARSGNKFAGWRDVTPMHNALVDTILTSPIHIIATMRSKMEYAQEKDEKGRTVIRRLGLQPIQREGMEYEFDVFGSMNVDHDMSITKTRCDTLDGGFFRKPGAELAQVLHEWLSSGVEPAPRLPSLRELPRTEADADELEVVKLLRAATTPDERLALVPRIKQLSAEAQGRVRPVYAQLSGQV